MTTLVEYNNQEVIEKLAIRIYDYFFEEYEDVCIAQSKSEAISVNIAALLESLDCQYECGCLVNEIHTLKHLLLYADLDDASDLCQDLELLEIKKLKNRELVDKIIENIVK